MTQIRPRRTAAALLALGLGLAVSAPARADLITYEFQNASGTGTWGTITITGSFTLNTVTDAITNSSVDFVQNGTDMGLQSYTSYDPSTDTATWLTNDNYNFVSFASDLSVAGTESLTLVALSNSPIQGQGVYAPGTAAAGTVIVTYDSAIIPEPATLATLGIGLAGLIITRRRRA